MGLSDYTVKMLFSLSKQTIMNDNTADGQARLLRMTFVEFLEFIGRIAIAKFFNSEMEELPLSEKISYILDDLFVVIGV